MPSAPRLRFKIINLEDGMPSVSAGLARLEEALCAARKQQCTAVKIIHGYGSSGTGSALRQAMQAELARRAKQTSQRTERRLAMS